MFINIEIANVNDFLRLPALLPGFVFRGQSNSEWRLQTTLERALNREPVNCGHIKDFEKLMLYNFKSTYHLYNNRAPAENDHFEWLAILQHYGAPTRLLDFSWSPYIAAHFACSSANSDCSIWAVNYNKISDIVMQQAIDLTRLNRNKVAKEKLNNEIDSNKWNISSDYVIALESSRPDIRVVCQQGLFLAQVATAGIQKRYTFEHCLSKTIGCNILKEEKQDSFQSVADLIDGGNATLLKFDIPLKIVGDVRLFLDSMGISEASLFPGIAGFAASQFHRCAKQFLTTGN